MLSTTFETRGAAGAAVRCDLDLPDGLEGSPRAVVVVLPGFKGFANWGFFPDLGRRLAAAGMAALRVDFSHNGTGRGADRSEFTRLDLFEQDRVSYRLADLAAAISAAEQHEPRLAKVPRVLLGHSLGGGLALVAAQRLHARAIVTLNAVCTLAFRADAVEAMERDGFLAVPNARTGQIMKVGLAALRDTRVNAEMYDLEAISGRLAIPWLIVHGDADETVPPSAARTLHAAAGESAELHWVAGGNHTFGCRHPFEGATPVYELAVEGVLRFLDDALGATPNEDRNGQA